MMTMPSRTENASPDQHDHVMVLCHMLSNRISRSFSRELDRFNVGASEWRVMLDLAHKSGASGKSISNRWAMDKMAVSRAVNTLEHRGWVRRRQSSQDKRSKDLELTGAGRKAYENILPAANSHYHKLISDLDKSELFAFRNTLLKVIEQADRTI
jgi:DNA-binding MarR family transcriptional regulator